MSYYEDLRLNGDFKSFSEGGDFSEAHLKFILDAGKSAGLLTLTPEKERALRGLISLGDRGKGAVQREFGRIAISYKMASIATSDTPFMFAFNNVPNIDTPILFKNHKGSDRLVLPVPPETFAVQSANAQEEVTSVLGITYTHAGPIGLAEMSLEGVLPSISDNTNHPSYVPQYVTTYGAHTPVAICSKFITAMNAGQPIEFTVSDPKNQTIVMATKVVTVVDFSWEVRAGHGLDRFYTMTLREWVPQQIYFGGYQPGASQKGELKRSFKLREIADRVFPPKAAKKKNRNRWNEIYTMNKFSIDRYLKNVRAGKWDPNTANPWKKNVSKATQTAITRHHAKTVRYVSGKLTLPANFALQFPVGANIKTVVKTIEKLPKG